MIDMVRAFILNDMNSIEFFNKFEEFYNNIYN